MASSSGSLDGAALLHNLPTHTTSFVGRSDELTEIGVLLGQARIVTLTGAGGVGKTRLAVKAATDLLAEWGDGVWMAELAALDDPDLVSPTVAAVAGVVEAPDRPVLDTLVEALRTRELLLILDNCEHVLEACRGVAHAIARNCPKVRLLATSREPLGVDGEYLYRVPSLSLPTSADLAHGGQGAKDCEAVRLFVDRAAAHQPKFRLDESNMAATASICSQLDGIPLAIELAAARLRSLAVADIENRLDDRFRLLTSGYKSALPRQQTLRALIDWSYDLLDDTERRVLSRLSVFAGTFDLAAAEEVASTGDVSVSAVLDIVASLVDKSLVQCEPSGLSVRYQVLETVRRYAARKLEDNPEDERATRDRHATLFLRLADSAAEHFERPDEAAWRDRLEADNANLGVAFHHLASRDRGDDLLRLAETLYWFSNTRGAVQEHLGLLRAALEHPSAQRPTAARAQALLGAASALVLAGGRRQEARELQRASLTIARGLEQPCLSARVLASLSASIVMASSSPESLAEAFLIADEAVTLSRSACTADRLAGALRARSAVHSFAGRYEEAVRDGLEAASLFRVAENSKGLARVLNNLGCDETALGRLDDAQRHLAEALRYSAYATYNVSFVYGNLALVHLLRGDPGSAREPALEALRSIRSEERSVLSSSTLYLAMYYSAVGETATAAVLHGALDQMEPLREPLDRRMREEAREHLAHVLGSAAFERRLGEGRVIKTAEQVLTYVAAAHPQPAAEPASLAQLSKRERELLALVARGRTDAQIAAELYISVRTVRSHLDRIRDKTGSRRRADLTRLAGEVGLIGWAEAGH
jgi:predicted ATPase/DNA-binding CsgD family transcriptional regulator